MAFEFEEKLRYLQEMGVDTPEGILQLLTGIGARGLDTPAERDYLKGVMDTTSDWTFDVDGKTEDYTFTGDAMPSAMAVQKMRDAHGITANEYQMDVSKALADADITKLGIGQRGLNTSAERDFLANTMGQGTALTGADITKLGIGARGLNTPAEREFLMKQRAFEAELMKLSSADLSSVLELMQGLTPVEKDTYMNHVLENGFSYGHINESAPLRTQGFQQYNTGTAIPNLGFGY